MVAVEVGERIVGVRCTDAEVLAQFRRLVEPSVVDGVDVFPNLSLRVGQRRGTVRDFHLLYRGGRQVLRTSSLDRLVRAAAAQLDEFRPPPEGTVRLRARAFVRDGVAVLVDERFGSAVDAAERRLRDRGWLPLDGPVTLAGHDGRLAGPGRDVPVARVLVAHTSAGGDSSPALRAGLLASLLTSVTPAGLRAIVPSLLPRLVDAPPDLDTRGLILILEPDG